MPTDGGDAEAAGGAPGHAAPPSGAALTSTEPTPTPLRLRGRALVWGTKTYVMAILNTTPDSFSGDGIAGDPSRAIDLTAAWVAAGADIVDVGGESTRPGGSPVGAAEELQRVIPVIEAIRARFDVVVSVDTYKAVVADAALSAGADIVNDVWALTADPDMAATVARHQAAVVLMHNRSDPRRVSHTPGVGAHFAGGKYGDVVESVRVQLSLRVAAAVAAGIDEDLILVDPGLGFGKSLDDNLALLDGLGRLAVLGRPILIGPSRKSFIGLTLAAEPGERLEGTAASVAVGIARGADVVRVHDVEAMLRVTRMADAITRRGPPSP